MQGREKLPQLTRNFIPVIDEKIKEEESSLPPIKESKVDTNTMRECFIGLAAVFPMQDIGEEGFLLKFSILSEIFKEYPIGALKTACVDFARTGQWFPRPQELIDRIDSIVGKKKVRINRLLELKAKIK